MTLARDDLGQHVSQQFNEDLENLHESVLRMGRLIERQLGDAVRALAQGDGALATLVIGRDPDVNAMEIAIDEECSRVLVRRQPAAGDLRLIFAVIKAVTDLERMGDQAKRVARTALESAGSSRQRFGSSIAHLGELVLALVGHALDAFARLDIPTALRVAREDSTVDLECRAITRQLLTYMMEDPRTIGAALHLVWAARALERAGDHAKNLAEYVVYAVHGRDLRHISAEERERQLAQPT